MIIELDFTPKWVVVKMKQELSKAVFHDVQRRARWHEVQIWSIVRECVVSKQRD
jgi:hypothetical protein